MTVIAYLALGSNMHEPLQQIQKALVAIEQHPDIQSLTVSPIFRNPPVGFLEQPDFYNGVCKIETTLLALPLLDVCLSLETEMGRFRSIKNGPRVIDIDVLLYDNQTIENPRLQVPHPKMKVRDFVLWPLYLIEPEFCFPDGTLLKTIVNPSPESLQPVPEFEVC